MAINLNKKAPDSQSASGKGKDQAASPQLFSRADLNNNRHRNDHRHRNVCHRHNVCHRSGLNLKRLRGYLF
jgi:hypothetical protein